ncbi:MAG: hypothetical protein ACPGVT_10865 [Maricaulaceae bacterium]
MAIWKSSHISSLALTAVLSAGLVLGGCSKKDETKSMDGGVAASAIDNALSVDARTVSDSEAEAALKALSLFTSGEGMASWEKRDGDKGSYVFTGLKFAPADGDTPVTVDRLELTGAHMNGDDVAFDKISLSGVSATDGDDSVITFDKVSIVGPSQQLASAIALGLNGEDPQDHDLEGSLTFDALNFVGAAVASDDVNMSIGSLFAGKTSESDDAKGGVSLKSLAITSNEGKPMSISLGSVDIVDLNLKKYGPLFAAALNEQGSDNGEAISLELMRQMQSMNMYDPDFKSMSIKDFDADIEAVTVDFDSITSTLEEKGDLIISEQRMTPMTITPSDDSENMSAVRFKEALSSMNYESLVFTSYQKATMNKVTDSMKLDEGYVDMKDGFRLSLDMDATGMNAYQKSILAAASDESYNPNNPDAIMGALDNLDINHMGFHLEDKSIIDRAFAFAALQQGGSADTLKTQAKAGLGMLAFMAQDEAQTAFFGELGTALTAFIDNGGTLSFEMKPSEDFKFSEIASAAQSGQFDIEAMGLSVTHK